MNGHRRAEPAGEDRHQQLGDADSGVTHVHPADAEREQDLQQAGDHLRLVGVGRPRHRVHAVRRGRVEGVRTRRLPVGRGGGAPVRLAAAARKAADRARTPAAAVPRRRSYGRAQGSRSRTTRSASSRPRRVSTTRSVRTHAAGSTSPRATRSGTARAAALVEHAPVEALPDPHLEQHPLHVPGLGVEHLARVRRADTCREPVAVRRGVLDVPPPHAADVGVGARPDAPPVRPGPVAEVVAAACAPRRARPVGDLVPLEAGGGEEVVGGGVLVRQVVLVRHRQLTALHPPGECGAVLHDQGVRRDVVGLAREGGLDGRRPVGGALPRRAVDEVEADLVEAGRPRVGDDTRHPLGIVRPVERGQHVRHGRLHAERDPVVAGRPQPLEVGQVDGVGVGLGGHLGIRRKAELGVDRREDPAEVLGRQQRRRTSAEEDRRHREVGCAEHAIGPAGPRRPRGRRTSAGRRRRPAPQPCRC